ncbi:hypothetical protein [Arsenophonus nasoniae]|uniref:Uncharacterized protein n=1 Tax=Arsenophonus nasoniae TaxID=638 RepID=A0AA95GYL5_9GAMM|nr:hypothetical protein [Arsenophonus nasoniae]WGM02672.1 hypothetical protein QE210_06230 [Arsenophonus nasoniae]
MFFSDSLITSLKQIIDFTSSTGKLIKIDSVSPVDPDDKYATIEISDSAAPIILTYVIQRNDNAMVVSQGEAKIKYDDITRKLHVLDFQQKNMEGIALKLDDSKNPFLICNLFVLLALFAQN